jgi:thioester reductase-like protein
LLDLVAQSTSPNSRFLFCSSIASVLNGLGEGDTVYEKLSEDPTTAVAIGYSQSKWVTEQICARANESTGLKDRVQVLRIGQLCGDTREGIWNESEGWPLMIKTAQTTGRLPVLREVSLADV